MGLLRLASFLLLALAALAGFGWIVHARPVTILGLIAAGLACLVASSVPIPQPPASR